MSTSGNSAVNGSPTTQQRNFANQGVPTILVSTKIDLRDDAARDGVPMDSFVSYKEGENLKNEIGAKCFVECSALTQENVKTIFDNALLIYLQNNPQLVTGG